MMKDQVQIQARNSLNVATANMVLNVMRIQKMKTRKYLLFCYCSNPVVLCICCIVFLCFIIYLDIDKKSNLGTF